MFRQRFPKREKNGHITSKAHTVVGLPLTPPPIDQFKDFFSPYKNKYRQIAQKSVFFPQSHEPSFHLEVFFWCYLCINIVANSRLFFLVPAFFGPGSKNYMVDKVCINCDFVVTIKCSPAQQHVTLVEAISFPSTDCLPFVNQDSRIRYVSNKPLAEPLARVLTALLVYENSVLSAWISAICFDISISTEILLLDV